MTKAELLALLRDVPDEAELFAHDIEQGLFPLGGVERLARLNANPDDPNCLYWWVPAQKKEDAT